MFNLNLFKTKQEPKKYHDAEIDLSRFDVAVIERSEEDQTVIAYYDKDGRMQEYWLSCSPEKHDELVKEFRLDLQTAG